MIGPYSYEDKYASTIESAPPRRLTSVPQFMIVFEAVDNYKYYTVVDSLDFEIINGWVNVYNMDDEPRYLNLANVVTYWVTEV